MNTLDLSLKVDAIRRHVRHGAKERASDRTADAILFAASEALRRIPDDTSPEGAVNQRAIDLFTQALA